MSGDEASRAPGEEGRNLKGIELLSSLDDQELGYIEARCRWRRYRGGHRIIESGSPSRDIFFVVDGSVNVVDFSPSGREVAFATIGTGGCFGELSAIDGQPRSASIVAAEDSILALLGSDYFIELLRRRADISFAVLQRLTRMVRAGDLRIMELSTLAANHRVYAELLRMAVPDAATKGLWVVRDLPALREVASRVSTTRETVARAISQLEGDGLVRRKGRNLYILDRDKLEARLVALHQGSGARAP